MTGVSLKLTSRKTTQRQTGLGDNQPVPGMDSKEQPLILVADDNADNREMMRVLLGLKGYEVIVAENGREAVEVALAASPDLILLDLDLPLMDGLSVARDLHGRQGFLKVPIVVVSGHDPHHYRQAALDAGCADFLLKPISFERLDEILQSNVPIA